ncbi:hypothetical protein LEP1GSC024_0863, partial [Leptospira noguchii str. 2001034031]
MPRLSTDRRGRDRSGVNKLGLKLIFWLTFLSCNLLTGAESPVSEKLERSSNVEYNEILKYKTTFLRKPPYLLTPNHYLLATWKTYPGEGSPNETYSYSNTGEYDLTNLNNNEFVTKSVRDNVRGNTSTTRIFTDPLGNPIRSEANTALSGINSIEESFFDYTKG